VHQIIFLIIFKESHLILINFFVPKSSQNDTNWSFLAAIMTFFKSFSGVKFQNSTLNNSNVQNDTFYRLLLPSAVHRQFTVNNSCRLIHRGDFFAVKCPAVNCFVVICLCNYPVYGELSYDFAVNYW
jgi:hypothetical protein